VLHFRGDKRRGLCSESLIASSAYGRHSAMLRVCVLCGSENKQRLFPYTALTD
jgi:hypothetical protein